MTYLRASLISLSVVLILAIVCKDRIFRYAPNIAVIYSDDDLLTSRRIFSSGRVWEFHIGHNLSLDVENIESGGNHCLYKFDNIRDAEKYESSSAALSKLNNGSVLMQCNGTFVNKYIKISVSGGFISEIDMTVSMIGTA